MNGSERGLPIGARSIDLNADLGEGFPDDRALLDLVTSASICCGAHAGSRDAIRRTLADGAERSVVIGAHPGYPDRESFGRREQDIDAGAIRRLIVEQCATLSELAAEAGASIRFLKPHGALYNQAQRDEEIARGVVAAAVELGLPLLGQPRTVAERLARDGGIRYIAEGFPDRRYSALGSLAPRSQPHAILSDPLEIGAQVVRLVTEGNVATLCIHGDDPRALANAVHVRNVLAEHGIALRRFLDEMK
jgi:UPF0271 protein